MFKIGDTVICKPGLCLPSSDINEYREDDYPGWGYEEGREFIITQKGGTESDKNGVCYFGRIGNGVYGSALELVTVTHKFYRQLLKTKNK